MMKQVIKGFMVFAIIIVNIMWAAWIFVAIWRGVDFFMVFNSIIMATLCLMCWLMVRRIEAAESDRQNWIGVAGSLNKERTHLANTVEDLRTIIAHGERHGQSPADTLAAIKERLDACKE